MPQSADLLATELETPPERWIIFGDSLSDNGLFYELSSAFLTNDAPFQTPDTDYSQSFTNGDVYADTWMNRIGVTGDNYLNLALGGADATGVTLVADYIDEYSNLVATNGDVFSIVTDPDPVVSDPTSPYVGAALAEWDINLAGQIDRYLEYFDDDPDAYTTASIFIGANDLSRFDFNIFDYLLFNQVEEYAAGIAEAIEAGARRLWADGVDRVILNTLPIAQLFYAWEDASFLERLVGEDLLEETSNAILAAADRLAADGITTQVVRIDLLSGELDRDGASYGFATVQPYLLGYGGDPEWVETAPGSGVYEPVFTLNPDRGDFRPDQRLFYDEIHPTEALHDVIAIFSELSVTSSAQWGSLGNDRVFGGGDDDFHVLRDGDDFINLQGGDDVALGGLGDDLMLGRAGSDLLIGGGGNDDLRGQGGSDLLAGGAGADTLRGDGARDLLIGGQDGDVMLGGSGRDHFIFVEDVLTSADDVNGGTVEGGAAYDVLWLVLSDATRAAFGEDVDAGELASLGLSVSDVERVRMISYEQLEALNFGGDLGVLYDEAQLWGVI